MSRINGNENKLKKLLNIYSKHKGLTIELTLKNGEKLVMNKERRLEENVLIDVYPFGNERKIPLEEINRADIFTW